MSTIIIENVPASLLKLYGNRINYNNFSQYFVPRQNKNIEEMTLLEYINSDEYKNDESKCFTPKDFLKDLQKYKK